MSDIADNFLLDLGFLLRERAFAAKEQFHAAQSVGDREFHGGRYMAYYEVISLMLSQAESFQLPADKLALQGLDAERDLIG